MAKRHINDQGITCGDQDNQEFMKFCFNNIGRFIEVEYNPEYADYSGIYEESSENIGFKRTFKIGINSKNSEQRVLLELSSDISLGGSILFAYEDAIKGYKLAKESSDMMRKIRRVEMLSDFSVKEVLETFSNEEDELDEAGVLEFFRTLKELSR